VAPQDLPGTREPRDPFNCTVNLCDSTMAPPRVARSDDSLMVSVMECYKVAPTPAEIARQPEASALRQLEMEFSQVSEEIHENRKTARELVLAFVEAKKEGNDSHKYLYQLLTKPLFETFTEELMAYYDAQMEGKVAKLTRDMNAMGNSMDSLKLQRLEIKEGINDAKLAVVDVKQDFTELKQAVEPVLRELPVRTRILRDNIRGLKVVENKQKEVTNMLMKRKQEHGTNSTKCGQMLSIVDSIKKRAEGLTKMVESTRKASDRQKTVADEGITQIDQVIADTARSGAEPTVPREAQDTGAEVHSRDLEKLRDRIQELEGSLQYVDAELETASLDYEHCFNVASTKTEEQAKEIQALHSILDDVLMRLEKHDARVIRLTTELNKAADTLDKLDRG